MPLYLGEEKISQISVGGTSVEPLSVTANGIYTAPSGIAYSPVTVNVSGGGGGLVYETGTYTPVSDVSQPTISYTNTHADKPIFIMIVDVEGTLPANNDNLYWLMSNWYTAFNSTFWSTETVERFACVRWGYKTSSSSATSYSEIRGETGNNNTGYFSYWLTSTGFMPSTTSTSRYWRSGRTYKWIAVWAS